MRQRHSKPLKQEAGSWLPKRYRLFFGLVAGLGFASGLVATLWMAPRLGWLAASQQPYGQQVNSRPGTLSDESELAQNPWGELKYQQLTLECPNDLIPVIQGHYFSPQWFFGSMKQAEVLELFRSLDLSSAQRQALQNTNTWLATTNGWCLKPDTNAVWSLSRQARARIYTVLARFPQNIPQYTPFRFPLSREPEWLANSGLSRETIRLARRLMYERGGCVCFSDLEICSLIPSEPERHLLVQTLSREPALLVKLQLRPNSDLTNLINYWAQGKSHDDVERILEALRRVPEGATMNISFFLPPFARNRLYCYPNQLDDPGGNRDCLWTALNFFNSSADARLLDKAFRQMSLTNDYQVVQTQPTFGDILLLMDKNEDMVHACIYVADKIVFSKNGGAHASPWVLMEINDMMSYYSEIHPLNVMVVRKKGRHIPPLPPTVVPEIQQLMARRK